jgi:ribosomal protein L7/L12
MKLTLSNTEAIAFIKSIMSNQKNLIFDEVQISDPSARTIPNHFEMAEKALEFARLVQQGERKLEAIKVLREMSGAGLKESKDTVDHLWRTNEY